MLKKFNTVQKYFSILQGKAVLKTILKFYLTLAILYILAFLLIWSYDYWSLQTYYIDPAIDPLTIDVKDRDVDHFNDVEFSALIKFFFLLLACFAAFFSYLPKGKLHMAIVIVTITMIENIFLSYPSLDERFHSFLFFAGSAVFVWLVSCVWSDRKISRRKE